MELVQTSGRTIAEVARTLSNNEGRLWNWVGDAPTKHARDGDPKALTEFERAELRHSAVTRRSPRTCVIAKFWYESSRSTCSSESTMQESTPVFNPKLALHKQRRGACCAAV